jgi:hypothetical protein
MSTDRLGTKAQSCDKRRTEERKRKEEAEGEGEGVKPTVK